MSKEKDCCGGCGKERDKIVCLNHKYIISLYSSLGAVNQNIASAEVNELSLGKSDHLRFIYNQVAEIRRSLEKIVQQPDYYGLENLLTKK